MKIRQICMVVLLWLGVIPAVQAQSFDKLWKEVEQAGKKSLPKTVIKLTDEIYRKGEKENRPDAEGIYVEDEISGNSDSRQFLCRSDRAGTMGETNKTAYGPCYIALIDSGNLC